MEAFLHFLELNFPILISHKYIFLFLGSAIEGANTMILGGFLVSTGFVSLLPIFFLFILGETINSYIWYFVGYFVGSKPIDKWGRSKPKSEKVINTVERYFRKYSGRAILITKFTYSMTIATLIMAGSLKYDIKKFSLYNLIGSIGWVCMTLFTGYFFGQSYKLFFPYFKNLMSVLIFLGGAVVLVYVLKVIFRSAFVRAVMEHSMVRHYREKLRNGLDKIWPNGNGDGGEKDSVEGVDNY